MLERVSGDDLILFNRLVQLQFKIPPTTPELRLLVLACGREGDQRSRGSNLPPTCSPYTRKLLAALSFISCCRYRCHRLFNAFFIVLSGIMIGITSDRKSRRRSHND